MNKLCKISSLLFLSFPVMALVSACSTMPASNSALVDARQSVQMADADPAVSQYAAVELQKAKENLQNAEAAWQEDGEDAQAEVEHLAYLAKQRAKIAMSNAATGEARKQIDSAGERRNELLISAREQQVEKLRKEAMQSEQEAERLREMVENLEANLKASETERGLVLTMEDILFDFDEATLKPGGEQVVQRVAKFLKEYPDRDLLIEGHTDALGPDEYNEKLSEDRALAVQRTLVNFGLNPSRIRIRGYGEQFPVANNNTSAGRQQNRRVEIVIANAGEELEYRVNDQTSAL